MNTKSLLLLTIILLSIGCTTKYSPKDIAGPYPSIEPDTAIDIYWGQTVIDPYRNLENLDDSVVMQWYTSQKKYYDTIMSRISGLDSLKAEIERYKQDKSNWIDLPRPAGDKLFYLGYSYKKNADILSYRSNLTNNSILLFDTDSLNKSDSTEYSIDYYEPSPDGKYLAFGMSSGGNEQAVIYIIEIETKRLLPDRLLNALGGNPQWLPDGSGFFYLEYIKDIQNASIQSLSKCIKLHILGNKSQQDKEILSEKVSTQIEIHNIDFPQLFVYPGTDMVLVALDHGTDNFAALFYAPLKEVVSDPANKIGWKQLFTHEDLVTHYVLTGKDLYYITFANNPNGIVEKLSLDKPTEKLILLEASDDVLFDMVQTKKAIYVTSLDQGVHNLKKIDLHDNSIMNIPINNMGTVRMRPKHGSSSFYQNSDKLFFKIESWKMDEQVIIYDPKTNVTTESELIPKGEYSEIIDLESYQVEVPSYDGTLVPLTIVHKKGIKKNGKIPLVIEAYGFYGFALTPVYSKARKAWLEKDCIFAYAHVRGGGDKGKKWYMAGFKDTKPNSWKDLIACAEYLIDNKYTSPQRLAVSSTSAGGITVGRAIIERPDLFKAAVISVGALNVLKHEVNQSKSNIAEYGSVNDSLEFENLLNMDVYHNIDDNQQYPTILFSAGLNDSRMLPWLSGKAVARFQSSNETDNTILYNVRNDGHVNHLYTYEGYSFLLWQLGYPGFELK